MFVEYTPGGELAKRLREQLLSMEKLMGFKIKVVERAGTPIKDLFSPTNVWGVDNVRDWTVPLANKDWRRFQIAQEGILCMKAYAQSVSQKPRNQVL